MMEQQNTSVALEETAVQELVSHLRGTLLRPGDAGYEQARQVYNGMIDKHPALIARCVDVADVIAAVNFAHDQQLTLAVRGGGHNGPGLGTCDDGLVIDLSEHEGDSRRSCGAHSSRRRWLHLGRGGPCHPSLRAGYAEWLNFHHRRRWADVRRWYRLSSRVPLA